MKFDLKRELKNPIFWFFGVMFLGGMIIGGWGWDKETSTILERTKGGVTMMIIGGLMIVGGVIGFLTFKGDSYKDDANNQPPKV